MDIKVGDSVTVKQGASVWMRQRGYWIDEWPQSIDGMTFKVVADYTHLTGEDAHLWLENSEVKDCGVNPMFAQPNAAVERSAPSLRASGSNRLLGED